MSMLIVTNQLVTINYYYDLIVCNHY